MMQTKPYLEFQLYLMPSYVKFINHIVLWNLSFSLLSKDIQNTHFVWKMWMVLQYAINCTIYLFMKMSLINNLSPLYLCTRMQLLYGLRSRNLYRYGRKIRKFKIKLEPLKYNPTILFYKSTLWPHFLGGVSMPKL